MNIKIKRVYEKYSNQDGYRVLVDRLWPRGVSKEKAGIDLWLKEIAPSKELRKWFNHEQEKWGDFKNKYFEELSRNDVHVMELIEKANNKKLTLLYSSKEKEFNHRSKGNRPPVGNQIASVPLGIRWVGWTGGP